jgi:hypothetical protein
MPWQQQLSKGSPYIRDTLEERESKELRERGAVVVGGERRKKKIIEEFCRNYREKTTPNMIKITNGGFDHPSKITTHQRPPGKKLSVSTKKQSHSAMNTIGLVVEHEDSPLLRK